MNEPASATETSARLARLLDELSGAVDADAGAGLYLDDGDGRLEQVAQSGGPSRRPFRLPRIVLRPASDRAGSVEFISIPDVRGGFIVLERARAESEKMLEDHVYWVLVYWRWMKDANFKAGPANFFKRAPALIRPLIIRMVLAKVRRNLHGHGISRHNEAEMTVMSDRAFEALSQLLGENKYLMGNEVCGADATAFAFVAGALTPVFESPVRTRVSAMANLVAYRDRMMAEFYK